jgi:hypothetical protein
MSKTTKNVLGDQQGKIGKMVGRVTDGVQMYSALGRTRNPRTKKQQAHRARFTAITHLGQELAWPVNVGFRQTAAKTPLTSAWNVFVKKNFGCVSYDTVSGVASIDYEHVMIAEGRVLTVDFAAATFGEGRSVRVTFEANTDAEFGAFAEDEVYVTVYCPELHQEVCDKVLRSAEEATLTMPRRWTGKTVYVWGFVKTSVEEPTQVASFGLTLKPGDCSVSTYLGSGVIGS